MYSDTHGHTCLTTLSPCFQHLSHGEGEDCPSLLMDGTKAQYSNCDPLGIWFRLPVTADK